MFRIQSTALRQSGEAIVIAPGASVEVRDTVGDLARVYADAGKVVELGNPFNADENGAYDFFVDIDDFYDVTTSAQGESVDKRWYVPAKSGDASRAALVTAIADGFVPDDGKIITAGALTYQGAVGSTAIADLPGLVPVLPVSPDHWSSTTGTNATPGAQAAIDYLESIGGGTLRLLPGRTYNFTASVTVSGSYITIDATGAKITVEGALGPEVDGSNRPNGVFEFIGVEAAQTALSADAAKDATTVTVSNATGIEAGQIIRIFNAFSGTGERWYTDGATTVYRHFITRILDVTGTTLTLADPLPMSFDATTFTCIVRTWDGLHGCRVIGGDWDAGGYERDTGNGEGNALVYAEYCQDLSIRPETIRGFNGAAAWVEYTHGFKFTCGYMEGHRDSYADPIVETENSGFYGVRMDDCKGCVVGGFTANRLRHVVDGARTWDAVISDIIATNSHRTPFGTHNGCSNWLHKNLSSRGPNGGFLWRGFDCSVDGLFIDAPNDSESAFYDVAGAVGDLKRTYHLSNFQTNMGRASIQLNADIDTCIINGGIHKGALESAAYPVIDIRTPRMNTFQMNGGVVQGPASRLVDFAAGATERRTVSFTGTEFRDYTTSAVRCEAVTGATSLRVTGGYFAQSGGATKVHVDAIGTYQNLQRNGFVAGANFTYQPDNEGDWTPTLGNRTINCTLDAATSTQWRRDGDRVTVSGEIRLSSVNGATASMYLGGLPFSVFRDGGGLITWASGFDTAASTDIRLRAITGDSDMLLVQGSTGTDVSVSASAFEDTTRFFFTATYTTDD